jgi:DNA-binding CsgD family transcriptional regulator
MLPSSERLSKLLGIAYDAAADPMLWDSFLEELAICTGATSAGLLMHDYDNASYALSSSWRVDPESLRLYGEHYYALDVWARGALERRPGYVCTSQALCPQPEVRISEIYSDFMVEAGIEHGMFGLLENSESRLASVSLYRDKSCAEFTETDLKILELLTPHVQRAFKLHLQFSEMRARAVGFETTLDMIATGVILLDAVGRVVLMNRSASATMAERDGLLVTRDGLCAERQPESAALGRAVREAAGWSKCDVGGAGGTVLISRRTRRPVQVLVSPIRNADITGPHAAVAIAFVVDPLRRQRPAQDILRAMFGLTPAECRVALLLGDGQSPKEIAGLIGVSVETVRSQIKSIFSKTNVRRQSDLVRLLLTNSGFPIQTNPVL